MLRAERRNLGNMKLITILIFCAITATACAQNFAVKLARDDPNSPANFPPNWPINVQPIGDRTNLPPAYTDPPWRFATGEQVRAFKAANEDAVTAYFAAREQEELDAKNAKAAAMLNTLQQIANSSGNLSAAQLSEAVRTLAKAILFMVRSGQIDPSANE
jgi:hypothetical protein